MNPSSRRTLPKYLYAHPPRNTYKFRLPGMEKFEYFEKDTPEHEAIALFAEVCAEYAAKTGHSLRKDGKKPLVWYIKRWRLDTLPVLVTRRGRKPLAPKTRKEYAQVCRMMEQWTAFDMPPDQVRPSDVRKALSTYLDRPRMYNYFIVILRHVFRYCIKLGLTDENPMVHIESEPTAKRDVYLDHAAYLATREAADNEWLGRVFDLCYLVTARPSTVLALRDENISDGIIHFSESKNEQRIELAMNADLEATVEWLRSAKREAHIISRHLVVHLPRYSNPFWRSRLRGKPVTLEFVSKAFADAVIAAGFEKSAYRLYDLRAKGVTDEMNTDEGERNKGAHRDLRTRDKHYVRVQPPVKIKNTLQLIK